MRSTAALLGLVILISGCGHRSTYAEGCGPLPKDWITPRQGMSVLSQLSVISVASDGSVLFNGIKTTQPKLAAYLKETGEIAPTPVTQITFAAALDCDTVHNLRQLMATMLDCRYGKCAEGNGKWWLIGDVPNGNPPQAYDPDAPTPPETTK